MPFNCSKRAAPAWLAGSDGEEAGGMDNDDMGDFMAEILAEEVKKWYIRAVHWPYFTPIIL